MVTFAKQKLGTNYVYGMKGAVMSKSKYDWLKTTYPQQIWDSDEKKVGSICVDCSGLISWFTGIQRSSGGYQSTATTVLPIKEIAKAVPGCALWRSGHIGIYIGDGYCIEARGSAYGVVQTKVEERNFTHILWLKDIDYATVASTTSAKYKPGIYEVTCGSLNQRKGPGTNYTLAGSAIHKGDKLTVIQIQNNAWGYAENLGAWVNVSDMYCRYLDDSVENSVKVSGTLYSNRNGGSSVKVNRNLYIVKIYNSGKYPYAFSKMQGGVVFGYGNKEVIQNDK